MLAIAGNGFRRADRAGKGSLFRLTRPRRVRTHGGRRCLPAGTAAGVGTPRPAPVDAAALRAWLCKVVVNESLRISRRGKLERNTLDGCGRVDDHICRRQRVVGPRHRARARPGSRRRGRPDPPRHLRVEPVAQFGVQAVEAVVLDDLAGEPGGGIRSAPRSHQHGDLGLGDAADDALDQGGAQKAVAPVMKKRFPRRSRSMGIGNVLPPPAESVYHLVSAQLHDE